MYRANKSGDKANSQGKGPQLTAQDIKCQTTGTFKQKIPQKTFFYGEVYSSSVKKQNFGNGYLFNKPKIEKKASPSPQKTPEPVMHEYSSPSRVKKVFGQILANEGQLKTPMKKEPSVDSLRKSASLNRAVMSHVTPEKPVFGQIIGPIERMLQERFTQIRPNRSMSKFLSPEEFSCRSVKKLAKSYEEQNLQDKLKHIIHTNPAMLQQSLRRNIEEKLREEKQIVYPVSTAKKPRLVTQLVRQPFWSGKKKIATVQNSPARRLVPGVKVSAFGEEISQISHNIFKGTPKDKSNRSISLLKELGSISVEDYGVMKSASNQHETGLNTYSFCFDKP